MSDEQLRTYRILGRQARRAASRFGTRAAQCRRKSLPHRPAQRTRGATRPGAAPARGCRGGTSRAIGRNGPGCPGPAAHAGHPRPAAYRSHSRPTPRQAWPRAQRAAGAQRVGCAADADHPGSAAYAGHSRAAAHRCHAGRPAHRGHAARQARQTLPQRKAPQEKLRHPQGGGLVLASAGRRERRRPGRAGSRVCLRAHHARLCVEHGWRRSVGHGVPRAHHRGHAACRRRAGGHVLAGLRHGASAHVRGQLRRAQLPSIRP